MKWINRENVRRFWLPAFLFAAALLVFNKATGLLPWLFNLLRRIVGAAWPIICAFVIAFILYIPQNALEKLFRRLKARFVSERARGLSVLATYSVFIIAVAVLLSLILPWLVRNLIDFLSNAQDYYDAGVNFIKRFLDEDGRFLGFDVLSYLEDFSVKDLLSKIDLDRLSQMASGVFKAGSAVVKFFVAMILSVYMLLGRDHLIRVAGRLLSVVFPKTAVKKAYGYIKRVGAIFYSYIYSQGLDSIAVSLIMTMLLLIMGVSYAPLFGLLIGVGNLIPYFGAVISCGVVAIFVLITDGWVKALVVLAVIVAAQQFDANFLQPRIVGHTVGIRPVYVLMAITVFGNLFGFWGILLGVPLVASLRMIVLDIIRVKEERQAQKQREAAGPPPGDGGELSAGAGGADPGVPEGAGGADS